ncbi:MAG: hypothetical protein U0441_08805 [Polyangiaceae bacterium]
MDKPAPRRFHASVSYSVFGTDLLFGSKAAFIERRAATGSLSYRVSDKVTLQIGAGATLGGRFEFEGARFSLDPGWLASFASTWRIVDGRGRLPFVIGGVAVGATGGDTRDASDHTEHMLALDVRISGMVGKTFYDVLSPYLVARAFGGPIFWRYQGVDRTGTDQYHVQLGAGVLVALPSHFDAFAEAIPLGERAAVAGLGYSF